MHLLFIVLVHMLVMGVSTKERHEGINVMSYF